MVIGLVLIGLSAVAVYAGHQWGNETKETSTPGSSSTTGASGASGATGATGATGKTGATAATATTKTTTTKSFGSDSLLTAAFATGAALVALGVLYPRLRTLKLPGGVELGFVDTDNEEKKKLDEKVEEKVKAGEIAPEDATAVKQRADTIARAQKVEYLQSVSGWGSAPASVGWGSDSGSSKSAAPWSRSSNWPSSGSGWGGPKLSDEELAQSVEAAMAVGRPGES
jgi:hypothetical protein